MELMYHTTKAHKGQLGLQRFQDGPLPTHPHEPAWRWSPSTAFRHSGFSANALQESKASSTAGRLRRHPAPSGKTLSTPDVSMVGVRLLRRGEPLG